MAPGAPNEQLPAKERRGRLQGVARAAPSQRRRPQRGRRRRRAGGGGLLAQRRQWGPGQGTAWRGGVRSGACRCGRSMRVAAAPRLHSTLALPLPAACCGLSPHCPALQPPSSPVGLPGFEGGVAAATLAPAHGPAPAPPAAYLALLCHEALADFKAEAAWAPEVVPAVETGGWVVGGWVGGGGLLHAAGWLGRKARVQQSKGWRAAAHNAALRRCLVIDARVRFAPPFCPQRCACWRCS